MTQKSTGDPTCPWRVPKAKEIARSILGRAQVADRGRIDSDDEDSEVIHRVRALGSRQGRRAPGAHGVQTSPSRKNR